MPTTVAAGQAATKVSIGRILGVLDADTGTPVEGAEVIDRIANASAITTKSGLVGLAAFRSQHDSSVITVRKIGYRDTTFLAMQNDTVPITLMLEEVAPILPAMLTEAMASKMDFIGARDFNAALAEKNPDGKFITPDSMSRYYGDEIGKAIKRKMMLHDDPQCRAAPTLYLDDHPIDGLVLKQFADNFAAVVVYQGPFTPVRFHDTKCGVILLYSRGKS